jgi:pyruvate formate lyase activating enzyme
LENKSLVFNIQRFSIHDGPGIRTTVFLKGCTMRCYWCHNPEGRLRLPQIQFFENKCIGCLECIDACINKAHLIRNKSHVYQRDLCKNCGCCVDTCYSGALEIVGEEKTVDQVMKEILSDSAYYKSSKGGVTLSGGEPAICGEFTREVLKRCQEKGIHTAIETCGNYDWEKLENLLPVIDLVMMDLKHMDADKHLVATGQGNKKILINAQRLAQTNKAIIFRTPIVPTFNDTVQEISAIAQFVYNIIEMRNNNGIEESRQNPIQFELLPFHKLAADKYRSLGIEYKARDLELLSKEKIDELKNVVEMCGVPII